MLLSFHLQKATLFPSLSFVFSKFPKLTLNQPQLLTWNVKHGSSNQRTAPRPPHYTNTINLFVNNYMSALISAKTIQSGSKWMVFTFQCLTGSGCRSWLMVQTLATGWLTQTGILSISFKLDCFCLFKSFKN